jgi:hypothetical protein
MMASYNFSSSLLNGYNNLNCDKPPQFKDPFRDPSDLTSLNASLRTGSVSPGTILNNGESKELQDVTDDVIQQHSELWNMMDERIKKKDTRELPNLQRQMWENSERLRNLVEAIQNREVKPLSPPSSPEMVNRKLEDDIISTMSRSTIKPNESASLISPRREGTKLTTYSGIRSSIVRGSEHDNIVGGYELNAEDHLVEIDAINNIQKVYGLPRIFIDDRLNFLVHLHKPLQSMLTHRSEKKVNYPDPNSLEKLTRFIDRSKGRSREPHHELLYQVLKATIDLRKKKIKANPFNLPIIEVGMQLDDQLVYMCISELYSEFRTSWFHSMKMSSLHTLQTTMLVFVVAILTSDRGHLKEVDEKGEKVPPLF